MIAIVDSGIANLGSVEAAFRRIGVAAQVVADGDLVRAADGVVLPGVGAFPDAMAALEARHFVEPICLAAEIGVPVLGICLGMQLLAEESEEFGRHKGLGLIPGQVVRLQTRHPGERVPNIGWCDVMPAPKAALYRGVAPGTALYFAHSYALACRDADDVVATIRFGGETVTVGVQRGNIHGAQFHPEKSQDGGLAILTAFAALVRA